VLRNTQVKLYDPNEAASKSFLDTTVSKLVGKSEQADGGEGEPKDPKGETEKMNAFRAKFEAKKAEKAAKMEA
jgi:hypothetical protein